MNTLRFIYHPLSKWRTVSTQLRQVLLRCLVGHWNRVAANGAKNKMDHNTLAICVFGAFGSCSQSEDMMRVLPAVETFIAAGQTIYVQQPAECQGVTSVREGLQEKQVQQYPVVCQQSVT